MIANYSPRLKSVMRYSREEAGRLNNESVDIEHLMLGILREGQGKTIAILQRFVDLKAFKGTIDGHLSQRVRQVPLSNKQQINDIVLGITTEQAINRMYLVAKQLQSDTVRTEHLFLSILKKEDGFVARLLAERSPLNYDRFVDELQQDTAIDTSKIDDYVDPHAVYMGDLPPEREPLQAKTAAVGRSKTPVLDNYGRDLTYAAEEGRLDPIVGRQLELERIAQILTRRKKNNPILIGEPGVGKSAIAEGLALRIVQRQVPHNLLDKRVFSLDLAMVVSGTKYRGQFEERMKAILNELNKNTDVIIFIDEIHTLIGAGNPSGSMDASNMFKPALARGELQCIGATTLDEYRNNIEKDGALERRFQKIMIDPTTPEETIEILNNIKIKYEDHHLVTYTPEAIKACVYYTNRYIPDRFLPDKAIDALDEAGARVHITNMDIPEAIIHLEEEIEVVKKRKTERAEEQKYEEATQLRDEEQSLREKLTIAKKEWEKEANIHRITVTDEDIAAVVSMMSGIPIQRVSQDEGQRLRNMESQLRDNVIGQENAVNKIIKAIRRNRAGIKDPNKPIGNFIFLGPTGVGKTHLAKMLAKFMFDSESALVRIDMSEYMEKFAVSRLIGAPPGYVGHEEGGQLTERVRRKPYSIVLLDEIEKAHPDIFNILLQMLDEGQLTDSLGRKVDFRNTVIIMTSNVGTRQLKDFGQSIGFSTIAKEAGKASQTQHLLDSALKKTFSPEFLNRIDDVIIFNALERKDIHKIIDIELAQLYSRTKSLNVKLQITDQAKDFIVDKAWNPELGARPLKRAIQNHIEDPIAEEIILDSFNEGTNLIVNVSEDGEKLEVKNNATNA
ncbi:ATP-dependent Clp protease ClpC [Bacteroidia bacterium]|nr:ATP-dependent Clp protease ClpC [Bacteroidia bacterium]